jgi:hypothetical protein
MQGRHHLILSHIFFVLCILKESIVDRARIYLYVRQPLAGGPQGRYTTTDQRRRLAPALEGILVVHRSNLIYRSVKNRESLEGVWQT